MAETPVLSELPCPGKRLCGVNKDRPGERTKGGGRTAGGHPSVYCIQYAVYCIQYSIQEGIWVGGRQEVTRPDRVGDPLDQLQEEVPKCGVLVAPANPSYRRP
jgi:hypothetical protein